MLMGSSVLVKEIKWVACLTSGRIESHRVAQAVSTAQVPVASLTLEETSLIKTENVELSSVKIAVLILVVLQKRT